MVQFIGKRVQVPQREDGLGSIFSTLAAPLMNTLQNDLRRAQLTGMEAQQAQQARELAAREGLAVMFEGGDLNPAQAAAAGLRGGIDPKTVTGYNLFSAAGRHGVGSQQADNAAFGGGAPFAQTAMGTREGFANQRALQQQQEATKLAVEAARPRTVLVNGVPTDLRTDQSYGKPASVPLTEQQGAAALRLQQQPGGLAAANPADQAFVSAQPRADQAVTPRNYRTPDGRVGGTIDGRTDIVTGAPLPQGTTYATTQTPDLGPSISAPVNTQFQQDTVERTRFKSMLNFTRDIALKDPTLFGVTGQARRLYQEGIQIANNVAMLMGAKDINDAKASVVAQLGQSVSPQILSEMFDPNLPALASAGNLLIFQAAAALAGQKGRAVTDKDIQMFRGIAGDPTSMFESQQSYIARLNTMEQMVDMLAESDQRSRAAITGQQPAAPAPGVPTQPAPQTPSPAPTGPQTVQTSRGTVTIRRLD